MIFFYLSLILLILLIYKFVYIPLVYWRKRKIPYETPIPFLGSFGAIILRQSSVFEHFDTIYQRTKHHRCVGIHQLTMPALMINDPELIKEITIKHFDHFMNHRSLGDPKREILFSKNLFSLDGQEWKDMRNLLSPTFTGSKMRLMFGLMSQVGKTWTDYYKKQMETERTAILEMNIKDTFQKYTNDVIATCAFGIECDSFNDPNNEFFRLGRQLSNLNWLAALKVMLANFAPNFMKVMGLKLFPDTFTNFFVDTVRQTIKYRTENNFYRPDMIQLLMEARQGTLKYEEHETNENEGFAVIEESQMGKKGVSQDIRDSLNDESIAAQVFIFFLAGFENISTQLSLLATELAINVDVQTKLHEEIKCIMDKSGGQPSYENVMGMKYLDMVVSEVFRKWPQGTMLDRKCTKEFTIEPTNSGDSPITLQVGDLISVSIVGFHRDPEYFEDPMKFDPERFSDENKGKILPYTYFPFGIGPRACIGSRFALMEVKLLFVYLLHQFHLEVVAKTSVPLVMKKSMISLEPLNGYWLGLKLRQS